eukprot:tig00000076_g2380.t1
MFDAIKGRSSKAKKQETKEQFIERTKHEREQRRDTRVLEASVLRLQQWVRRIQEAQRVRRQKREAWDHAYRDFLPPDFATLDLTKSGDSLPFSKVQPTAEDLYRVVSDFLRFYRSYDEADHRRLLVVCHVVLQSMESTQPEYNYASNVLESRSGAWQFQIRSFLLVCMRKISPPPTLSLPSLASASSGGPPQLRSSRSLGSSRAQSRAQSRLHSRTGSRELEEMLEKERTLETLPLRCLVVFTDATSWRICTTVMFTDTGGRLGKQTFYSRISMGFLDFLVQEGLYNFVHTGLERALMGHNAQLRSARAVEEFFKAVMMLAVRPLQFPQTWPIPSKIHDKYLQFALATFSHANVAERLPPTAAGLYQRRETFCGCVMALENAASAVLPSPPISMLAGHEARLRALVGNLVEFAVPWLPSLEDMVPPFVQLLHLVFTLDYEFLYPGASGSGKAGGVVGDLEPGFLAQVQHLWSPHFVRLLFRRLLAREERKRAEARANAPLDGTSRSFFGTNELGFNAQAAAASVAQQKDAKAKKRGLLGVFGRGHGEAPAPPQAQAAGGSGHSGAGGGEDEGTSSSSSKGGRSKSRGGGTIGGPSMAALRVSESVLVCSMYVALAQRLRGQRVHILNALAFLPDLLAGVFRLVRENRLLELHTRPSFDDPLSPLFSFFCECYTHLLIAVDDEEFFVRESPFPLRENAILADMLNRLVFRMHWRGCPDAHLAGAASALLHQLHVRDARRAFCSPSMWLLQERDVSPDAVLQEALQGQPRALAVLRSIPHVIPFERRVELFRALMARERAAHQRAVHIKVRRNLVIEDGFAQLGAQAAGALRNPVKVTFVNAAGLEEAGIDQRGLFKEFLEDTLRLAFSSSYGLFVPNAKRDLHPSVTSGVAQPNHLALFRFLGRLLAKALYEGIVVEIPLAPFFLLKLLGRRPTIEDLPTLDAPLYKSLCFLKTYSGNVGDLSMDFTVTDDLMGRKVVHELRPGGSKISVTEQNRIAYVHLMADYRLNRQIQPQCDAFLTGFYDVVPPDTLRLFSSPAELQRLISGDNAEISVDDMRRHTLYAGGYTHDNKVIKMFWEVVEEMSGTERRALLKFATSCSRPPLLGFGHLQPPFTIHQVQTQATTSFSFFGLGVQDTDRLPTAATCFNTLKLPAYKKKKTMREKLLQAISSSSGFELS